MISTVGGSIPPRPPMTTTKWKRCRHGLTGFEACEGCITEGFDDHHLIKMEKLYIIVRNDIPPGLQIAQACHAQREFAAEYPDLDREWHEKHRNIVVLQIPDLRELAALANECERLNIPTSRFLEPDLDNELTAIALAPTCVRLVSSLPLALRAPRPPSEPTASLQLGS